MSFTGNELYLALQHEQDGIDCLSQGCGCRAAIPQHVLNQARRFYAFRDSTLSRLGLSVASRATAAQRSTRPLDAEDERTAWHEIAHCTVAKSFGAFVEEIRFERGGNGACRYSARELSNYAQRLILQAGRVANNDMWSQFPSNGPAETSPDYIALIALLQEQFRDRMGFRFTACDMPPDLVLLRATFGDLDAVREILDANASFMRACLEPLLQHGRVGAAEIDALWEEYSGRY